MATLDERLAKKLEQRDAINEQIKKLEKQQKAKAEKERVHRVIECGSTLEKIFGCEFDKEKTFEIADAYRAAQALADALGVERLTVKDAKAVAELAKFGKAELERRKAQAEGRAQQPAPRPSGDAIWAGEPSHGIDPLTGERF